MEKLNELVELAKKATSGEWIADSGEGWDAIISQQDMVNGNFIVGEFIGPDSKANKDFVLAASPENILAIAEAFRALEQRASNLNDGWLNAIAERDEARAKLSEMEKQEPAIEVIVDGLATDDYMFNINKPLTNGIHELFTRPAPAADMSELVPDEMTWNQAHSLLDINQCGEDRFSAFMMGANHNRAAILRNIEDAGKKHE